MHPRQLRRISPLLPFTNTNIESTPEDHATALQSTKVVLTKIRDMVRELDLPADVIPTAVDMFSGQLHMILSRKEEQVDQERLRKIYEIEQAMVVKQYPNQQFVGVGGLGQYAQVGMAQDAGIYGMTPEQLDAEYNRVVKNKG